MNENNVNINNEIENEEQLDTVLENNKVNTPEVKVVTDPNQDMTLEKLDEILGVDEEYEEMDRKLKANDEEFLPQIVKEEIPSTNEENLSTENEEQATSEIKVNEENKNESKATFKTPNRIVENNIKAIAKNEIVKDINEDYDFNADVDENPLYEEESNNAFTKEVNEEEKNLDKYIYKSYENAKIVTNASDVGKINVDLNNIHITRKDPLYQVADFNAIFNNKPSFNVVCCQSGYSANLTGLTHAEKTSLINSQSNSVYQERNKVYKLIYDKISSMSIKKPNYNDWLKMTSFYDLQTLLFGIYCQTFIDNNDFDITCGKCSKVTSVTINNKSLIEIKDKETYEKIDEIVYASKTAEEVAKNSLVHKLSRVLLDNSKIIVDIRIPSLFDHLSLLKAANPQTMETYSDQLALMLFIEKVYIFDITEFRNTNSPAWYPVDGLNKTLDTLLNLGNDDGEQLDNCIEEELTKYQIKYEIHNAYCTHCKEKLNNIPIDMEQVLFTRLNRPANKKKA